MTWRNRLRQGSFRGVRFHIDENSLAGGRRNVVHEFPKKDLGYVEDMGRRQRPIRVRGYLIGPSYDVELRGLTAALEAEGPGLLVLQTQGEWTVICDTFTATESREEGGFATVDMEFIEAGSAPAGGGGGGFVSRDTGAAVNGAAETAQASSAGAMNDVLEGLTD